MSTGAGVVEKKPELKSVELFKTALSGDRDRERSSRKSSLKKLSSRAVRSICSALKHFRNLAWSGSSGGRKSQREGATSHPAGGWSCVWGRAPRQSASCPVRQARSLPPREITSSNSLEIAASALLFAARSDSISIPPEADFRQSETLKQVAAVL